jgi:hypothetical protein
LKHRRFAGRLAGPVIHQRVPEIGPANGETDETPDTGRRGQPLSHLLVVLAATEHNAANLFAAAASGDGDYVLAVLTSVETLDFPNIRFHSRVPQLLDRLNHEFWPEFEIVSFPIPV